MAFMLTGTALFVTRFSPGTSKDQGNMTWKDAALIGLGQALALFPGISRSGITISLALMIGLDRRLAARYSFLLAIPAILGAASLQSSEAAAITSEQWIVVAGATLMAAVTGYFALRLLLRIVISGNLSAFAYYCWGIGLLTLIGVGMADI